MLRVGVTGIEMEEERHRLNFRRLRSFSWPDGIVK
jgi:hypothetical protein